MRPRIAPLTAALLCVVSITAASTLSCVSHPNITLATPTPLPPSPPVGLAAVPGPGQLKLLWDPNGSDENVLSYKIYVATTAWIGWSASLPGARLETNLACCEFTLTGLTNDVPYWISLSALNSSGEGAPSGLVSSMPPGWQGSAQVGSAALDEASAIAVARDGSLFFVGPANGSIAGKPYLGVSDMFVAKLAADGSEDWLQEYGSAALDYPLGVTVDTAGDAFVAGSTQGAIDGGSNAGLSDIVISKFDPTGGRLWSRMYGTSDVDVAEAVRVADSGAILIAGYSKGGLNGNTNQGVEDVFLMKTDSSGAPLWTRQFGSPASDIGQSAAMDANGNTFVCGYTAGTLPGQPNANAGGADLFVAKYDSGGTQLWVRQFGSAGNDQALGVAIDSAGNAYLTGSTGGNLGGIPAAGVFVVKYSADGTVLWTRVFATSALNPGRSITALPDDSFVVAGRTSGAIGGGTEDAFLLRIDDSGDLLWSKVFGTSSIDFANGVTASEHALFVAGHTEGAIGGLNSGGADAFVAKFGFDGVVQ